MQATGLRYTLTSRKTVVLREMKRKDALPINRQAAAAAVAALGSGPQDEGAFTVELQGQMNEAKRSFCLLAVDGVWFNDVTSTELQDDLAIKDITEIDGIISKLHDVTVDELEAVFLTARLATKGTPDPGLSKPPAQSSPDGGSQS